MRFCLIVSAELLCVACCFALKCKHCIDQQLLDLGKSLSKEIRAENPRNFREFQKQQMIEAFDRNCHANLDKVKSIDKEKTWSRQEKKGVLDPCQICVRDYMVVKGRALLSRRCISKKEDVGCKSYPSGAELQILLGKRVTIERGEVCYCDSDNCNNGPISSGQARVTCDGKASLGVLVILMAIPVIV